MVPNVASDTSAAAGAATPAEAVTPLMRGIGVLRLLTEAGGTAALSDLERASGLARSTVDRITATLARMGHLRLDGRDAVLAPRLMELGNAYLAALRLPRLLDAHADALADELDESVSLAVADQDGIRFIHQATRRRAMSLSFRIGDLLPAERTAPGPLFAAEWGEEDWARWRARRSADPHDSAFPAVPPRTTPPLRADDDDFEARAAAAGARGWSLDDQLIEPGLVALAMPVRDADGRTACVVSVVSHTSRHTADDLRRTLLPRLRTAVTTMEREVREARETPLTATTATTTTTAATTGTATGLAAWTGASKQELGREFVESLARGLTVITAFGEGRAALTLSEVAEATGLARATARRALITLTHLGHVTTHDDRAFRLTPRVLELGFPPLSRTTLPDIAAPHLKTLSARLHESASLAVLTGDDIQYTARAATSRIMSVNLTVGTRLPAYATALGRVLLADLPQPRLPELKPLTPRTVTDPGELTTLLHHVRTEGYALVDGELEEGLLSIAVPVRELGGRAVAAVNVAQHSSRRTPDQCVRELLPELRATVHAIEADLHVAGRFRTVPNT
ncbi:IclR family transcriptional regulator C-terminal domain-containing protein [Streptomyces sp. CRN 30]|uniref:IclR family transcriptional regulator domain-containing protein n=1 Tax=Streptomyces sp. CRN 30 TaxID=3075613 RepID=UPI002A809DC5|nr:IclR family transcriptional regulator C-terminal domain-containing protein [Streptomyces sp. CRN 30]